MHRAASKSPRRGLHRASCSPAARRASTTTSAPLPDKRLFEAGIPLLGICYGMQAMGYLLGGHVVPAERREYGPARLPAARGARGLLDGVMPEHDGRIAVWMSHGDTVMQPPPGLRQPRRHRQLPGRGHGRRRGAGSTRVQFHPEVAHTAAGQDGACELPRPPAAPPATGRCPRSSTPRSRPSADRSAGTASCARSPAAWTPRWWPR